MDYQYFPQFSHLDKVRCVTCHEELDEDYVVWIDDLPYCEQDAPNQEDY